MSLEVVTQAPRNEDFTPLSEYQSQTPTTFFGARAVLYHHSPGAKLAVRKVEYDATEELQGLPTTAPEQSSAGDGIDDEEVEIDVDVWVTSQNVILFSNSASEGIKIGYLALALHAQGPHNGATAVILQVNLHDADTINDDADIQTLTLNVIPAQSEVSTNGQAEEGATNGDATHANPNAKAIYEALSACADLHYEGSDDEDNEGGIELPEPGTGGWITADNMHEFMDADGNFTGPQIPILGAGAGQVRTREGEHEGEDEDETKWRRTD